MRLSWRWLLLFRLLNASLLRTSFTPDEYWQGPEVAHAWVYGYGHLTWEWQPCVALRGVLHPGLFAVLFLFLDSPALVAYGPRLLQGAIASVGDAAVYRAAERLGGPSAASWTMAVHLGSWFQLYCLPRTYSSSLEAVLFALALEQWLRGTGARLRSVGFGAVAVALRPTAAGYWLALALYEVVMATRQGKLQRLVWEFVLPGFLLAASVLALSTLLDSLYYGEATLVPWNFLAFNLLNDGSALYGSHAWYWYATEGLAVTLGTYLPFFLAGAFLAFRSLGRAALAGPAVGTVAALALLSLASHKEYRFLLPFFPLFSLLSGAGLQRCNDACLRRAGKAAVGVSWPLLSVVFVPQVVAALLFCVVHQRGAEGVMSHLRAQPPGTAGVFFLTHCHSTPFYSFLHREVPLAYLDCSPGTGSPQSRFFQRPLAVLGALFPEAVPVAESGAVPPAGEPLRPCLAERSALTARALPEVFVVWASLLRKEELVSQWLGANGYELELEIQDGIWSEGPYGVELWPSFRIYRALTRADANERLLYLRDYKVLVEDVQKDRQLESSLQTENVFLGNKPILFLQTDGMDQAKWSVPRRYGHRQEGRPCQGQLGPR
ncbi:PIGB [Symbiodinium natans]|uniref:Mannosyltransferase n=1 Tax=Symbiodinium natans TaxID=878477 RepID=A0A812SKA6_9DINO|nr:PIGB [Symbiodinium natans]